MRLRATPRPKPRLQARPPQCNRVLQPRQQLIHPRLSQDNGLRSMNGRPLPTGAYKRYDLALRRLRSHLGQTEVSTGTGVPLIHRARPACVVDHPAISRAARVRTLGKLIIFASMLRLGRIPRNPSEFFTYNIHKPQYLRRQPSLHSDANLEWRLDRPRHRRNLITPTQVAKLL